MPRCGEPTSSKDTRNDRCARWVPDEQLTCPDHPTDVPVLDE